MVAKKKDGDFVVKYTNRHIMDELQSVKELAELTLQQAKLTNGRVTRLENKSVGMWAHRHPMKLILYTMILSSILISDSRDIIFAFLMKLVGL